MNPPSLNPIRPIVLALLLSGCHAAGEPPRAIPTPTDPAGQRAAAVLQACEARRASAMACYEQSLLGILTAEGVESAMGTLERMGDLDEDVKRDGHVYAHAIGLAAFTTPDQVGRDFDRCTPSFQSGCYHGVIQSYFVDQAERAGPAGVTAEVVNTVCGEVRAATDSYWKLFQCAHGIGHGLTMLYDHQLPRALAGCDMVADEWERQACYGGAFMENVVQATAPHHTVGRPHHEAAGAAASDEHAGHDMGGQAAAPAAFRPLDPDRPLYPCTVLEDRYLPTCYQMQTSAILFFNEGDVAATARACDTAPEGYRPICYQSLGRDISARTLQDHAEAQRLCALGDPGLRGECYVGYVKNVVDLTARADDGFAFCRTVPDAADKRRCYQAVGEEVWVIARADPEREALCAGAEPDFRDACRSGAGLVRRTGRD